MINRLIRYTFLCLLLVSLAIVACKKQESKSTILILAEVNLLEKSPDIKQKVTEIKYTLTEASLADDVLAQTRINSDGSGDIFVDVSKVKLKHDRLEPVIGHEIYHIWEANKVYGVDAFLTLVASEKATNISWNNRTFEKSAIALENQLRVYLITNYSNEFGSMPKTRDLQNVRN